MFVYLFACLFVCCGPLTTQSHFSLCTYKILIRATLSVTVFHSLKFSVINFQDPEVLVWRHFCPDGGARGKVRWSPEMLGFILWGAETSTGN